MFSQTTYNIEVKVQPSFIEHQSVPEDELYVWSYQVEIANRGLETIRLRSRHWKIVNARGEMAEVHGEGIVGKQPLIPPGGSWTYVSYTNLTSASGVMYGAYACEKDSGELISIDIPVFSLDSPYQLNFPN
jgi:ApaG protein